MLIAAGNNTINTGKGDDTIYGNYYRNNIFQYANGDGNDVIHAYKTEDIINLTSGTVEDSSIDGSDVILKIGSGSIKLTDAVNKNITIINFNGNKTSKTYGNNIKKGENSLNNIIVSGTNGDDSIKNRG